MLTTYSQQATRSRGRRRGGRTGQAQGRNGNVATHCPLNINTTHLHFSSSRLFWCGGGGSCFRPCIGCFFYLVSYLTSKPCISCRFYSCILALSVRPKSSFLFPLYIFNMALNLSRNRDCSTLSISHIPVLNIPRNQPRLLCSFLFYFIRALLLPVSFS